MKRSYMPRKPYKWNKGADGKFQVKPGARVEKRCPVCGEPYFSWSAKIQRTCSRRCSALLRKRTSGANEDRNCKERGKTFPFQLAQLRQDSRRGQYCSAICRNAAKVKRHDSKPVNPRYKHEAHLKGDKEWKRAVRERDGYTCQRCGKYDLHVHAHHVNPRSQRPDLIREVSNGKCLCASCHAWVHMNPKESTKLGLLGGTSYEKAMKVISTVEEAVAFAVE